MALDEVMLENIVTTAPLDSLRHVAYLFEQRETHHILVVEDDALLGIISDRDLLVSIHPNSFSEIASNTEDRVLNKTANQIMTPKPYSIKPNTSIISASELMLEKGISALPVLDERNRVIGVVSLRAIVNYFVTKTRSRQNKAVKPVSTKSKALNKLKA